MIICNNCKSEILVTAKFCSECGNKVEIVGKTCPNKECNRKGLPEEAIYCPDCGKELNPQKKAGEHLSSPITKETKLPGSLTQANKNENRSNEVVWLDQKKGYFIDSRDNQKYMVIRIENQVWMAENLRFRSSNTYLTYSESSILTYGFYYDWDSANRICPIGWHLPSNVEYHQLGVNLSKTNKVNFRDTGLSHKLKSCSGWKNTLFFQEHNGNNASGLNFYPSGVYRKEWNFLFQGTATEFWTSTLKEKNIALVRWIERDIDAFFSTENSIEEYYMPIRCIRD